MYLISLLFLFKLLNLQFLPNFKGKHKHYVNLQFFYIIFLDFHYQKRYNIAIELGVDF